MCLQFLVVFYVLMVFLYVIHVLLSLLHGLAEGGLILNVSLQSCLKPKLYGNMIFGRYAKNSNRKTLCK